MAMLLRQEMVGSKIDILVRQRDNILEQRNFLQTLLDGANEVLQLATSWLSNYDGANDVTFKDINKMIDDKLMLLSDTDISVDCEKIVMQQENTTIRSLPTVSSSTDQPLPAGSLSTDNLLPAFSTSTLLPISTRHDQVSDELKAIANQVKVMQDAMTFLSKSTENISEKQLTMEKFAESLSAQCSKIEQEQEQIRKIETQLKNIDEKQKKTTVQQDKKMKSFDNKITAATEAQSVLEEKWQTQIKEQKKKNERQSQTFTQDLNAVLENVQELSTQICELERKVLNENELEDLKTKIQFIEGNSESLSAKLEKHFSLFEEFTRKTEETFDNLSSERGREFENMHKLKEKISDLEMTPSIASLEAREFCTDVEVKYKMMCKILADRIAPLEKLRDIFNKNLDKREKHLEKMDNVCDQMANILPKIAQLETDSTGSTIGFSARLQRGFVLDTTNTITVLINFSHIISNNGNHFNPTTGEFTVPVDGLYATSLSLQQHVALDLYFTIKKQPCMSCIHPNQCYQCSVAEMSKSRHQRSACAFVVVNMKAGEKLSVICKKKDDASVYYKPNVMFVCFRIG